MSKRILYIEDNPENRMLMRRVLMSEGYIMEEAFDGNSGLQKAAESPPDLILMDINLPEIDGYEVTARLKQLPNMQGVPIIAVTANVMKGDREKTLAAGCDGYIQKPIDIDLLPSQIESFLKRNEP
jgi:two-component system cell cycle response regulator DivK